MPAQFSAIPVQFGGLDLKSDPKQVLPGKLLVCENAVFSKPGVVQKRHGTEALSTDTEPVDRGDVGTITAARGVSAFLDELLLFDGQRGWSYSTATAKWQDRGPVTSAIVDGLPIHASTTSQRNGDVSYADGLRCVVWEDSGGGCYYSVQDVATGAFIVNAALYGASGTSPRVVAFGRYFYVFWQAANNVFFKRIQRSTPAKIEIAINIAGDAIGPYNVAAIENQLWVAWCANGGTPANVLWYDVTGQDYVITSANVACDSSIAVFPGIGGEVIHVCASDPRLTVRRLAASNAVLGTAAANFTDQRAARCTGYATSTTQGVLIVEQTDDGAPETFSVAKRTYNTQAGTISGSSTIAIGYGLASDVWEYAGHHYVVLVYPSAVQPTYFVYDLDAERVVAKLCAQSAGGRRTAPTVSGVPDYGNGVFELFTQTVGRLQVENGVVFTAANATIGRIDYGATGTYQTAQVGRNLLVVGGIVQAYDGQSWSECGFHVFPEMVSPVNTTTGGATVAGTYLITACYEWTDAIGQIHRSAPAIPVAVTPIANQRLRPQATFYQLSDKQNVRLVFYRTDANGVVFHKLAEIANNPGVETSAVGDVVDNGGSLAGNALLYTVGGVLDAIAPPSASIAVSRKGRVFLAGLQDKYAVAYSQDTATGEPVAFNDALVLRTDERGGPVTALGVLDDKLVIFKASSLYVVFGEGPTNTGAQDDFSQPQLVSSDVGCINPKSVVTTSQGLLFQSTKGIYILDRSLQVAYLGAPVEDYNGLTILGGVPVPDTNQVRFVTRQGPGLVWDFQFNQWSTFSLHEGEGCTVWRGKYTYAKASGVVYRENDGYADGGTAPVRLRVKTGWLQFAGLQGFQRARKALVLGDYKGPHRLRIRVAFDYQTSPVQDVQVDATSIVAGNTYGSQSPYGAELVYGGVYVPYQFEVTLVRQKCQAVQLEIDDLQSDSFNEGLTINAVTFLVGVERGTARVPAARSF